MAKCSPHAPGFSREQYASKYKNIFAKGYTLNWSEVFIINKIKNTVPWTYVIRDLNGQ